MLYNQIWLISKRKLWRGKKSPVERLCQLVAWQQPLWLETANDSVATAAPGHWESDCVVRSPADPCPNTYSLPPLQLTSCLCTDFSGLLGQPALDICALVCSAVAMAKRVAVILSGCGVYDGTEIHEASAVLVHLSREGAKVREGHWRLCDDSWRLELKSLPVTTIHTATLLH